MAAGGIININEAYQLNGAEGTHARRDLRGGNARGRLELLPRETASQDGSPAGLSIRVTNQWCVQSSRGSSGSGSFTPTVPTV